MTNYFQGTKESPYHISVGAVLINDEGKVCCHYFEKQEVYILMRESMELGEKIEDTLHRGLKEEFGAEAELIDYLGSNIINYSLEDNTIVQKTTLYFLCKLKNINVSLRSKDDSESGSEIQWKEIDFLISKFKTQNERLNRNDLDESEILERVKKKLSFNP